MAFQSKIFSDNGISEEEIWSLRFPYYKVSSLERKTFLNECQIVCTGIYNAGKSTLLNALTESEHFPVGAIPTTKKVSNFLLGDINFVDTPGLNATGEDDEETRKALKEADIILFVSSAQNGGIGQVEAKWLTKLYQSFSGQARFQQRFVYVLSQCQEIEPEQLKTVCEKFKADFQKVLGFPLQEIYPVDAKTWFSGVEEGEEIFKEQSKLPQLRNLLQERCRHVIQNQKSDQKEDLDMAKKDFFSISAPMIQKFTKELEEEKGEEIDFSTLFQKARKTLQENTEQPKKYLHGVYPDIPSSPSSRTIKENSESAAMREARDRLFTFAEKMIRNAQRAVKEEVREITGKYTNNGMGSAYFQRKETIAKELETLFQAIIQGGGKVSPPSELTTEPDLSDGDFNSGSISAELTKFSYLKSARDYVDCVESSIRVDENEYGRDKKGLFGSSTTYEIYDVSSAAYEIERDIVDNLKECTDLTEGDVAGIMNPFLAKLRTESLAQLNKMEQEASEFLKSAQSTATNPKQQLIDYLNQLEQEVKACQISS